MNGPEQGFDTAAISGGKKELFLGIVKAESVFAPKLRKKGYSIVLVQGHDDLRVASTFKLVTGPLDHIISNTLVIIELAVDDGMDGTILVAERLLATGTKSIDLQSAASET